MLPLAFIFVQVLCSRVSRGARYGLEVTAASFFKAKQNVLHVTILLKTGQ